MKDLLPLPRYVILGKTHPKVQAAQGDSYLDGLKAKVHALGLEDVVEFDSRYLDTESLASEIRRADVVLLPYESREQVTSGVLVEALAAGKPVVATDFPRWRCSALVQVPWSPTPIPKRWRPPCAACSRSPGRGSDGDDGNLHRCDAPLAFRRGPV